MRASTRGKNSHRAHHYYKDLQHDFENIKSALSDATMHAKGRAADVLSHSVESMRDKSVDMRDTIEMYITTKPFKSVGIAIAAGWLLGILLRK